jgi:hypothetical protein
MAFDLPNDCTRIIDIAAGRVGSGVDLRPVPLRYALRVAACSIVVTAFGKCFSLLGTEGYLARIWALTNGLC